MPTNILRMTSFVDPAEQGLSEGYFPEQAATPTTVNATIAHDQLSFLGLPSGLKWTCELRHLV